MVEEGPARNASYPAEKARGADIVLKRRWQKVVFFGGLIGIVLLLLILRLASLSSA